jgi:hypothetical protein
MRRLFAFDLACLWFISYSNKVVLLPQFDK